MTQWTDEQLPVINSIARLIRVIAFAGTGKTTTLEGYARQNPHEKICYIAYNTEVAREAKRRFPRNVDPKTSHGLAYGPVGSLYKHKSADNLRLAEVARALNTRDWALVKKVVATVNSFLCSTDPQIEAHHYPRKDRSRPLNMREASQADLVVSEAIKIWRMMQDQHDSTMHMTHDGYLKAYLLGDPDLSNRYQTILLDEGQDTNKLLSDFVYKQYLKGCKVIIVGDRHQQLYRFRGAESALDESWLDAAETHYLTKSFRFGFGVAHVANILLALKGERVQVQGWGAQTQIKSRLPGDLEHRAVLFRTVAGVLERALSCLPPPGAEDNGQRIYWVGGIKGYQVSQILDLYWFSKGELQKIKNYRLKEDFDDIKTYREVSEATKDPEMFRMLRILDSYRDQLPSLVAQLETVTVEDEIEATITLSTVHRSKGLEWPYVELGGDFTYDPLDPEVVKKDPAQRDDELNLYYVAVTRARLILALNSMIIWIMQYAKSVRIAAQTANA